MRLAFIFPVAVTAMTAALAQTQPDRPRVPMPPLHPGAPGTNTAPGGREGNAAMPPHPAAANSPDQIFLSRAMRCGLAQVELARLAERKAASPSMREFARQMVMEYEQGNRRLRALAEGDGGGPEVDQPDAEQRQIHDALGRLSGAEFQIEYLRQQVQAHQRMATLMEYVIGSGTDAQVSRVASEGLPGVFTHLALAQQLLDQALMQNPQIAAAPPRILSGMPTPQTPRAGGN
jgi:putative membrane protein